ncbi:MAG: rod shape-determining protein [Firmicutes bacterium HGW-Firmicutes-1]|jgi:rod shape-determining protein MreB|nr:MAG: rod shape-determining protein [Firmicutes bacterium HGW-Firmicutes-1]
MIHQEIGIDLGTANTLIYRSHKGLVYNEPTVIAVNKGSNRVLAVGTEAKEMLGRTHDGVKAVKPLLQGIISNYEYAELMLKYCLQKTGGTGLFKPNITICVPSGVSEIERRAVEEVSYRLGARNVFILDEPIAAAVGIGIDINGAVGNMLIDVGGGTTDIAVISLGGLVTNTSVKLASDDFDNAIIKLVREVHHVLIGELMAEKIKMKLGTVDSKYEYKEMTVSGLDMVKGIPQIIKVNSTEIKNILMPIALILTEQVQQVLERTPPELVADIGLKGIVLTGGGSCLDGIDKLIEEKIGVSVKRAEEPLSSVGTGLMKKINGKYIKVKN